MTTMTPGECFLRDFHDMRTGDTGRGFARASGPDGRSSYRMLVDSVPPGARVLDLGCGDGTLLRMLADRGADALAGVDLARAELTAARTRLDEAEPMLLAQARAQRLPFASGVFDACVSHLALMLMDELDAVIAEAARVLVPGGVFGAVLGAGPTGGDGFALFMELVGPAIAAAPPERRVPRLGDRRARDPQALSGVLASKGFTEVEATTVAVDFGGPIDRAWEAAASMYDVSVLAEDTRAALRERFQTTARELVGADGHLVCRMNMRVVAARLVDSPP